MNLRLLEAHQGVHDYPVHVGGGIPRVLTGIIAGRDHVALVSCRRVLETSHGRRLARAVEAGTPSSQVVVLPDGERGKTLARIEQAASALLAAGATRTTLVVALGGGAVTDAAGFLAAVFMRGVPWVAVPTTLLGMVDAALGGKTAVNLPISKNAIGAFHPPRAVLADPAALRTLPPRELRSGLGEVVKYAALRPALLDVITSAARRGKVSADLIAECARIKLEVVERDPDERGERKLLNLGHTFGHGVETAGAFRRWSHGEAVAIGLAFAFRVARAMGRVDGTAVDAIEGALAAARLPARVPRQVARRAGRLMRYDKKRTATGLRWVLPVRDGAAWSVAWDVAAEPGAVAQALHEIEERR